MKPLRLTIQAFGPYAAREVVDFRAACSTSLFGIYGATGSGKSSIFSAMTFALFGEASRAEQHTTSLRSDHADAALMTEVDLIFEARGRQYRILRRPEQTRPRKRAGGETNEPHKAWLFDVTGQDLDAIDDANPGKAIAETKVADVKREVEKILGYGPSQFRQIVLLPQGRFESFLTASTEERLKILRDLFDVTLYRRVMEELRERSQKVSQEIITSREVCEQRLKSEGFAAPEDLDAGIRSASVLAEEKAKDEQRAREVAEAAARVYAEASETDKAFKEHLEAERDHFALAARADDMAALEKRLARARIAEAILPLEDARIAAGAALKRETERAKAAAVAKADAEKAAAAAKEALAAHQTKVRDIEAARAAHRELKSHAAVLAKSGALEEAYQQAKARAETASEAERVARETVARLKETVTLLDSEANVARACDEQRALLGVQERDLRAEQKESEQYDRALARAGDAIRVSDEARGRATAAEAAKHEAEDALSTAEAALEKSRAALLAQSLRPGEPCPVCGSSNHPALAKSPHQGDDASLAVTFERAKAALHTATQEAAHRTAEAATAAKRAAELEQELVDLSRPKRPATDIGTDLKTVEAALKALPPTRNRARIDDDLASARAQFETAEVRLIEATRAAQEAATAAALARQAFEQAMSAVPEPLRKKGAVDKDLARHEETILAFERELKAREVQERQASDALVSATRDAEHRDEQLTSAKRDFDEKETARTRKLDEQGLSAQEFEDSRKDCPNIRALTEEISHYADARAVARERLVRAKAAIDRVDRPDLTALLAARDEADGAWKAAQRATIVAGERCRQLKTLASSLEGERRRLEALEKETAPLRELAELCQGRSAAKIDLETFAIATMFDHVLEAANLRLGPMTRNRYRLMRDGFGRGNARRGLGIVVEDAYTGRPRATETLSGGETFIAALALALGLSDVVESADGSIRLDTIFIDEGFGSLDSESDAGTLEQVLETLEALARGSRSIGIISHVPLVQQAIPNGFWITKTATGSHISMRP